VTTAPRSIVVSSGVRCARRAHTSLPTRLRAGRAQEDNQEELQRVLGVEFAKDEEEEEEEQPAAGARPPRRPPAPAGASMRSGGPGRCLHAGGLSAT